MKEKKTNLLKLCFAKVEEKIQIYCAWIARVSEREKKSSDESASDKKIEERRNEMEKPR